MKKMIVNTIFKAFQSNQIMMHKIRLIQEEYNEINYKQTPPNFNDNHFATKGLYINKEGKPEEFKSSIHEASDIKLNEIISITI
jgi:hypothetical protein